MPARLALAAFLSGLAPQADASEAARLCRGDAVRLCFDAIPDRERIAACLKQRKAELTAGCQALFEGSDTGSSVRTAGR
ncbi:hypothetical protein [Methylorubrum sp. SB2]|uniref:hypothetical protein n=1 Tax=Methylorubrum subtropicum TaxID=3138812 RepID=UPI00313E1C40